MSASANKKLMQDIFAAAASLDPDARDRALFTASLADDAKWVVTGQYSWSRTFAGKEAILRDLHGYVRTRLRDRTRTVAHRFIADGDIVVVEAKGDNVTPEGVRYDNDYCLVFSSRGRQDQGDQGILRLGPDREGAGPVSANGREGRELNKLIRLAPTDRYRLYRSATIVSIWLRLTEIVRLRRERSRQRCQLAAMSERELQDCGMTRSEIAYELNKPRRRK